MARDFDPELHLRLAGERAVLDPPEKGDLWGRALDEMAAALVAVDALSEQRAKQIADDYRLALGLRGRGPLVPPGHLAAVSASPGRATVPELRPARVAACEASLDLAGATVRVHYVVLGDDRTTLAVSASVPPGAGLPAAGPGGRYGPAARAALHGLQVADDRGLRATTRFEGTGTGDQWEGMLHADRPLSVDTRWVDLGTGRLALGEPPPPPTVEVEVLPPASPAERYLRSRLTAGRHGPHGGARPPMVDTAVATLLAAGALDRDSPVVAEARDVVAAFSGQPPAAPLPEPWASMVAAIANQSDWEFVLPVGVVTPALCGATVAVDAVLARNGVLEAHVRVSPADALGGGPWSRLAASPVTWWARDDLGTHYLGWVGGWQGDPAGATGTVVYWPSLDARARRFVLVPTAGDRRALVRLELPAREQR